MAWRRCLHRGCAQTPSTWRRGRAPILRKLCWGARPRCPTTQRPEGKEPDRDGLHQERKSHRVRRSHVSGAPRCPEIKLGIPKPTSGHQQVHGPMQRPQVSRCLFVVVFFVVCSLCLRKTTFETITSNLRIPVKIRKIVVRLSR